MKLFFLKSALFVFICASIFGCQTTYSPRDTRKAKDVSAKAYNLIQQNRYDEAKTELDIALNKYPDYPNLVQQMGYLLVLTKKYPEAEEYLNRALKLDKYSPATYGYLGLLYQNQGNAEKALENNLTAYEMIPEGPHFSYEVGKNYLALNDRPNALKYFSIYLKEGSSGEKKKDIVALMKQANMEVPSYQSAVVVLIEEKKFSEADNFLKNIQKTMLVNDNGDSQLSEAYRDIKKMSNVRDVLKEWRDKNPKSAFASGLLGSALIDYAWDARGIGYSASLTDEGRKLYEERIREAKVYLAESNKLDSTNLQTVHDQMLAGKAIRTSRLEALLIFDVATQKYDPDFYLLQTQMLDALTPKWGGSVKEILKFARAQAYALPKTSKAPLLIPLAHWEVVEQSPTGTREYFREPIVWQECKKALDTAVQRFPNSVEVRTLYLRTAIYSTHLHEARAQYDKIKDRINLRYWESSREFIQIKKLLESEVGR